MDLDTIEGGDDFTAIIDQKIDISDTLIAVIGSRWVTITDKRGKRRLDDPQDLLRIEIERAFERGIRVIPALVGGATMPAPNDLPTGLRPLCERQAIEIRDATFHTDAQELIDLLQKTRRGEGAKAKVKSRWSTPAILFGAATVLAASAVLMLQHPKQTVSSQPSATPAAPIAKSGAAERQVPARPTEGNGTKESAAHAADISGKWTATVKYDWGDSYKEIFDFEVDGRELSGMAGFLGDRDGSGRTIVDGKITGNRVNFMTKTLSMKGSDETTTQDKHYYKGIINGQTIQFTMTTDSSTEEHTPIHFTATRMNGK